MIKWLNKIIVVSFVLVSALAAQEFKATVDRTTVAQNQQFQVYFQFSGGDNNGISNFNPPDFKGLRVLSGPNQSTNFQMINGRTSSSITYSYYVVATSLGNLTISPASIVYKGDTYKTDPITINVVKGQAQPQNQQSDNSAGVSKEEIAKNLFIVAEADKNSAYKGEQITITYKLYSKLEIGSPQINKLPQYKSFWAEELETSNTLSFRQEMFNGQRYQTALLKKVALFATKDGALAVSPLELNIPVVLSRRRSNSFFDEFFKDSFGRRETVDFLAKSNELKVKIKPLPEKGKPASFNGAVGEFSFSTSLDKKEAETNEPITLKVNISGSGNIKLLDVPKLQLPAGFEQYDPKTSENINRQNTVRGSKSAEYLIVPRIAGVKEIPPVEFSYFSPSKGRYITAKSPAYTLNIKRGNNPVEPAVSGFSKEDVKLLSEDIRYIKTSNFNLEKKQSVESIQSWFWLSLTIPLFAFFAFIGIRKRQDKLSGNIQLLKYQKAEKNARARLKNAGKALDAADLSKFHNEISQGLYGYLEDKLNIQKAEFTQERAIGLLKERGVGDELIERVKSILDQCEFVRFAPQMSSQSESGELHEKTIKVIVELESSILIRK